MGSENLELAHRINKGKTAHKYVQNYIKDKFGICLTLSQISDIFIHNPLNLVSSCSAHNGSFNIFFSTEATNKLIDDIYKKEKRRIEKIEKDKM